MDRGYRSRSSVAVGSRFPASPTDRGNDHVNKDVDPDSNADADVYFDSDGNAESVNDEYADTDDDQYKNVNADKDTDVDKTGSLQIVAGRGLCSR